MRAVRDAAVLLVLVLSAATGISGQTSVPPDWTTTQKKALQLTLDGRYKDAIAMVEPVVKVYPQFADGHMWLGMAYEEMGRQHALSGDRMGALKALDTAVLHMNQGFELGGSQDPEVIIRGLVDLLGFLGRTDARQKTIVAAVARYPGLPVPHWYAVRQALESGTDVADPLRTARAGIPSSDVSARLDYAGYLAASVDHAPPSAKVLLMTEVNELCEAAVKMRPGDRDVTAAVSRIRNQLAVAATPVDTTTGPAADETSATLALRMIASAQMTYSAVCASGFYAPSLGALARPARGENSGFLSDQMVPPDGSSALERRGYRIEMTGTPAPKSPVSCNGVKAGGSASDFSVTARPLPGRSGRSLRIDQSGSVTAIQ